MTTEPSPLPEPDRDGIHPRPPTPAPPARGTGSSNLALRLVTAALLVPALIYTIWVGGLLYLAVIMVIVLLGLREFYRLI
ncbi:MAG TPA: hypothetical protein VKM54_24655, partial [Myxococcota bacterium]|nr:hypothetical protein [Myxococcota bacterium]